jgi:hypothetical protein
MLQNSQPPLRAFTSCSLRKEDDFFISQVEKICIRFGVQPFGTVGRHDAAPTSPVQLMFQNIPSSDLIVIAATPRYLQKDLQTQQTYSGLSEMLHVEAGMAFASNKPISCSFKKVRTLVAFYRMLPSISN